METRQLAGIGDIQAVELECSKPFCTGTIRVDLEHNGLPAGQKCPVCERVWWEPKARSNTYRLLMVLMDTRRGTIKGKKPTETERWTDNPPLVRLVLPGRLDD